MPQLDIVIFFNQFFWFFGLFFSVYWFFAYLIVPKINFYYFVRYNIFFILEKFNNIFQFQNFTNSLVLQNKKELDVIRFLTLAWLRNITKISEVQKTVLPIPHYFAKRRILKRVIMRLHVQIIELFLSESFLFLTKDKKKYNF